MARAYYQCKECGTVKYRDYVPFILSNPVIIFECPCDYVDFQSRIKDGSILEISHTTYLAVRRVLRYQNKCARKAAASVVNIVRNAIDKAKEEVKRKSRRR